MLSRHTAQIIRSLSGPPKKSVELPKYDLVIVGGGIVGCATARQLLIERPNLKIALIEKEKELAAHQSGHNSGVLHAGIYYTPGSLKAKLCVEGIDLAYKFLDENNIPYKKTGKLIVAVEPEEVPRLDTLFGRAKTNGCRDIEMIDSAKITEIEPHCKGLKALWSPHTGIVDWKFVTKKFGEDFEKRGGKIFTSYPLKNISDNSDPSYPIRVSSDADLAEFETKNLITCAGLQSDRVAALSGCSTDPKIVPFRGEYLLLKPEKRYLVKTNIYPVPDPRFPFLGVHFTPRMNGDIWLGPNAVLAYKREGYSYFSISPSDLLESLSYRGMQKLVKKHFSFGISELYRGVWIAAQVKQLQRFIPELKYSDVTRGPSGVRAQAMDSDGNLVDDFVFDSGTGKSSSCVMHVRNAPSPAATSSLAIAKMITTEAVKRFNL
uniref:L-2-hydroxyglutarate dehydrogenase, mitochondrial n=1 Tax=Caenorhabditis japonica TaxID=281687 RepID=A0A8R1HW95_CAEJA